MNVSSAARAIGISRSRAQDKTATTSTAPANVTHDCALLPSFNIASSGCTERESNGCCLHTSHPLGPRGHQLPHGT